MKKTYVSVEVSRGVESDITESLHNVSLSLEPGGESNHVHVLFRVAEEIDSVVDSSASRRDSPMNTT